MELLNSDLLGDDLLLTVLDYKDALSFVGGYYANKTKPSMVPLRELSIETQFHIFDTWCIPYHVDRKGHCNILDSEAIKLAIYKEASTELSVALLGADSTTIMVIDNCVLVERSNEPGVLFVIKKESANG